MTAALRLDPGFDAYRRPDTQQRDATSGFRLRPVRDIDHRSIVEVDRDVDRDVIDDWSGNEYIEEDDDFDAFAPFDHLVEDDELDERGQLDDDRRPRRTVRRGRVHRPRTVTQTRTHGGVAARSAAPREVRPMVRATHGVVIATPPQLRVVPTRRRAARLVGVGFAVVFMLMIGAAAFQTQLARRQVELDKVDRSIRNANEEYSRLRQERAELRAPGRLAAESSKLGMGPGQETTFVALDPEVVAEVHRSAGGVFDESGASGSAMGDYTAVKHIVGSTP